MNQELKLEPFIHTVYCRHCLGSIVIKVQPECSATEAMLCWINSDQLCDVCRNVKTEERI